MKEIIIGPGENIFKEGDNDSRIYFVIKGEVELYACKKASGEGEKYFHLTKISVYF